MPAPHDLFKYRSADEVAECWDGVSASLYKALWNDVVHVMTYRMPGEDDAPEFEEQSTLARYWDRLSEDHQVELNDLARVEAQGE